MTRGGLAVDPPAEAPAPSKLQHRGTISMSSTNERQDVGEYGQIKEKRCARADEAREDEEFDVGRREELIAGTGSMQPCPGWGWRAPAAGGGFVLLSWHLPSRGDLAISSFQKSSLGYNL